MGDELEAALRRIAEHPADGTLLVSFLLATAFQCESRTGIPDFQGSLPAHLSEFFNPASTDRTFDKASEGEGRDD